MNLKVFDARVDDKSFQMDFGKAVHYGMEVLYRSGGTADLATLQATAMYDNSLLLYEDMHPSDRAEAARIREIIPSIFADILRNPDLQGVRPIKSELQLYESIARTDNLDVKFKGFIDFIFVKKLKTKTVLYIADFKTCQWGWPATKFRDTRVIAQLLLYKHFFCKLTGADPKDVTTAYILLKKKPKVLSKKGVEPVVYDLTVEVAKISSGPKALSEALDYLQRTITAMHSYRYTKNFESCERKWIDKETDEERRVTCPFLGTERCDSPVGSVEAQAVS